MVRLWAEKEMRNLKRLVSAGIPCPEPIEVRENVLVMSFLGDKAGWSVMILYIFFISDIVNPRASPRLKDADIPEDQLRSLYRGLLLTVRQMFYECKLVHADLSEYNILYHEEELYIIDVGQSVEQDHPSAFDFLRADLKNVEEFFGRRGVSCIGVRQAFEFVISDLPSGTSPGERIDKLLAESKANESCGTAELEEQKTANDKVFLQSYIPRTLNDVFDPERDVDLVTKGAGDSLIYSDVIGVVGVSEGLKKVRIMELNESEVKPTKDESHSEEESDSRESQDEEDSGSDDENREGKERKPRGHRNEDKEAKKVYLSFIL